MSWDWDAIRGWLGTGGIITLVGLWWRRDIQMRKLKNDDEADIRDHYAAELVALREKLMDMERHYREMLERSDKRHEECQRDREDMRCKMNEQAMELEGLRRKVAMISQDRFTVLEDPASAPETSRSHRQRKRR